MTKSFTGVCINRSRAQGKLALDNLIHEHLPEATSQDPAVPMSGTIANLLGHRTGLQKADNIWLGSGGELLIDKDQTASAFDQLRPQASLRSRFCYNNIAYALLAEVISKLTGQSYHAYLQENILDPLNLT